MANTCCIQEKLFHLSFIFVITLSVNYLHEIKILNIFSSLQIRQKINYNDISSLFIAPARPKTKPTPIYDATGRLLVTSTTITIRMPICYYNDNHGPIKNVQVLVAEAGGITKCQLILLNSKVWITEWCRNFSSKLVT